MNGRYKVEKTQVGSFSFDLEYFSDFDRVVDEFFEEVEKKLKEEKYWPVFGNLWTASLGLSQFIEKQASILKGKSLLELGCGLALPSMIATRLGAQVTASDFHPEVQELLARNLARNHISDVSFENIDWCAPGHYGSFDFIIASDILYEPEPPHALINFLDLHLKPKGHIYIADIGRVYFARFLKMMQERGFVLENLNETVLTNTQTKNVHIAHFTKPD